MDGGHQMMTSRSFDDGRAHASLAHPERPNDEHPASADSVITNRMAFTAGFPPPGHAMSDAVACSD
jgi:hypothetical protein